MSGHRHPLLSSTLTALAIISAGVLVGGGCEVTLAVPSGEGVDSGTGADKTRSAKEDAAGKPSKDDGGKPSKDDAGKPSKDDGGKPSADSGGGGVATGCQLPAGATITSRGDLVGPGGERAVYSPFLGGQRIGLSVRHDVATPATEEVELAGIKPGSGYETSLLYTSDPDPRGYYHPLPQVRLAMSDEAGKSQGDQILWTSPALSRTYPGRRAALHRMRLSRDRSTVGPVEDLLRSGPGGGYTSYYGIMLAEGATPGSLRAIVAGEAETRAATENLADPGTWDFRMESIDGIIGAYDLGDSMSAAKEVLFGAAPDEISGLSWIVENGFQVAASANGLYMFGSMETSFGKTGGQLIGHVTELGNDPAAADYLMPKRSWVVGRDGFPCGTQTMLNTGTMDEAGNIFVGGRTDATAADVYPEGGMRPYLVRIAPDGSIVQKVFRFADDFDLPTFAFGPLVLGTAEKTGGTSLYWAITAYDWLLIFRIDPTTLVPQQVLAVKPKGTGAPFTRNFFTSAALHDGKLYMGGSFSSKDAAGTPAVHGFVLVRNAADLGPVSGARLASPVEGYDVNLPISLAVDTADPRNMFIAGVAGRPTGVPDQEEYRSYVLKLRAPK